MSLSGFFIKDIEQQYNQAQKTFEAIENADSKGFVSILVIYPIYKCEVYILQLRLPRHSLI